VAFKTLTHATRLQRDQTGEIAGVQQLRREATDLRSRISQGSYGNEEARRLWRLAKSANLVLHIANSELAERAALGSNFFTTLVRDERRPKLPNFLRALTVMIEVADERLHDIDDTPIASSGSPSLAAAKNSRIERDHAELLLLALSLSQMARDEIVKLDAELPNHPETVAKHKKQRELLEIFADGFEKIAKALTAFAAKPNEPILLGKAGEVVNSVGELVTDWLKKNGAEVVDWAVRLPVLAAGVSLLGWAGADMLVGTTAVAALVGGKNVVTAIKGLKESK
jgi:hypothetical protein